MRAPPRVRCDRKRSEAIGSDRKQSEAIGSDRKQSAAIGSSREQSYSRSLHQASSAGLLLRTKEMRPPPPPDDAPPLTTHASACALMTAPMACWPSPPSIASAACLRRGSDQMQSVRCNRKQSVAIGRRSEATRRNQKAIGSLPEARGESFLETMVLLLPSPRERHFLRMEEIRRHQKGSEGIPSPRERHFLRAPRGGWGGGEAIVGAHGSSREIVGDRKRSWENTEPARPTAPPRWRAAGARQSEAIKGNQKQSEAPARPTAPPRWRAAGARRRAPACRRRRPGRGAPAIRSNQKQSDAIKTGAR